MIIIKNKFKDLKEQIKENLFEFFDYFYNNYYVDFNDYSVIKLDNSMSCVSEGIGYGMLIFLYFSNYDIKYKAVFDKLFNTYKKCLNKNNLMQWKVKNFQTFEYCKDYIGSATDAELDVAFSLIKATELYNDNHYLNEAKNIIDNIKKYEIQNSIVLPGDYWGNKDVLNLSYYDLEYFNLFSKIDNFNYWNEIIKNTYNLFKMNIRENKLGIFSDWCNKSGSPICETWNNKEGIVYGFEAVRIPYRLLKDINSDNKKQLKEIFYNFYNFLRNNSIDDFTVPFDIYNVRKSHYYKEIFTLSFIMIFYLFDDFSKINEYFEHFLKYKFSNIYYYETAITCLYLIELYKLINK